MSDGSDSSLKSEKASPFKLLEARRKGLVVKSVEVSSLAVFFVLWLLLSSVLVSFFVEFGQLSGLVFQSVASGSGLSVLSFAVSSVLVLLAVFFVPLVVVVVFVSLVQSGPVFSWVPLKPDFQRINPVKGLKQFFSVKKLFELGKVFLKLGLFVGVSGLVLWGIFPQLVSLLSVSPLVSALAFLGFWGQLLGVVLGALAVVALVDWLFVRWAFLRELRMSRYEVQEEVKRRDGDPKVKAKRKQLEKELRKKAGSLAKVPDADAIITNPVHLAVLVKYDPVCMGAPKVIGKGAGDQVEAFKLAAVQFGVPVFAVPSLARDLFRVGVGCEVPEGCYLGVAKVLRRVFDGRGG